MEHDYAYKFANGKHSVDVHSLVILNKDAVEDLSEDIDVTGTDTVEEDVLEKTGLVDSVNGAAAVAAPRKHVKSKKDHKCYTVLFTRSEKHRCVYVCDICCKNFRNKECSKVCITARRDPCSKHYLCEICGKICTYISSFIAHHNHKHSDQKLFLKRQRLLECSVCRKRFSTKWNLKTHMQIHTDIFPFLCEFCGKKFKKSDIFKVHLRAHTGIKPYSCGQCHKSFATKGMMTVHYRSHTGEKPYSCQYCDKKYAGPTALKLHQRTHTGERPYKCHLCPSDRGFISKKALRLHLKQPHHE